MYWWKNNWDNKKKVISIELYEQDGDSIAKLEISDKISGKEYMEFIESLNSLDSLATACQIIMRNGHHKAEEEMQEAILAKIQRDATNSKQLIDSMKEIISQKPSNVTEEPISEDDMTEVIVPSDGKL